MKQTEKNRKLTKGVEVECIVVECCSFMALNIGALSYEVDYSKSNF